MSGTSPAPVEHGRIVLKTIKVLLSEHALIRQYVDNLTIAMEKMEAGFPPPREFFNLMLDFSRTFIYRVHHFKE